MARIRTIKPEFFTSEDIVALTPWARLLYIALWCEADREGRLRWKPATFKMRYLPADNVNVIDLCQELIDRGLVVTYQGDIDKGIEKNRELFDNSLDTLAYIPKFYLHQQINNRETPSVLPSPLSEPRVTDASPTRQHAPSGEGKGKERNTSTRVTIRVADFEKFWTVYPRKDSKVQAEKAFAKIATNEQVLTEILAGVERAVTSEQWCKDEGKFIPYASTWLNQRRWEDAGTRVNGFNGHSDNPFA